MGYYIGAVLAHIIDLAGLAGLIAALVFPRRKDALAIALVLAALASLWTPGLLVSTSYIWRLATNVPAALLVAWVVHKLRYRQKPLAEQAPEQKP